MSVGLIGFLSAGIGFLASVAFTGGVDGWFMFATAVIVMTFLAVVTDTWPTDND